jgi:hypothetical protein
MSIEAKRSPHEARVELEKRQVAAEVRARDNIDILKTAAAMHRHQMAAGALQRILLRGRSFALDTLADMFLPQPWAVSDEGALLGHLLTIDGSVFDQVADAMMIEVLTFPEALEWGRFWSNLDERSMWAAAYVDALRGLAATVERQDISVRERAILEQVAPNGSQ